MKNNLRDAIGKVIQIAEDYFTKGNLTVQHLINESGYASLYKDINETAIEEELKASPHLIDWWLEWSDSKPSPSTWRFYQNDDGCYQVWHSSEQRDSEGLTTKNKFKACAAFIKRELENFK
jgi:hypothetical protein